jgi:ABC-type Fe3+-hydroxamate transport system substrate-binding protein
MATYIDDLHRQLEVKTAPQRIVSLVPSLTETLFAFGLGEHVVGVTNFCVEPRDRVAEKARVGGTKTLEIARVRDLEPDLVIANAEENREEDIRQLLRAGLSVFMTFPRTVHGAISMMRRLADVTGSQEAARPIIEEADAALHAARAANQGRRPLRVFCPIWRRPWMTIGPDTYMHDLIAACGGINIFADRHDRYPRIELDEMARRIPEVILLPSEPYNFALKHAQEFARYGHVPAVRDERMYVLDGKHLGWYGPRIAGSLRYVRALLWGDQAEGQGV